MLETSETMAMYYIFSMAQEPPVGQGLLIIEASR
jgi:hypothetical protein